MNPFVVRQLVLLGVFGAIAAGLTLVPTPQYPTGSELTEVAIGAYKIGNYDLAERMFANALAAAPQNFRANYGEGLNLMAQKRYIESLPYFQRALQLQPNNLEASISIGACLQQLGQYDKAEPLYEALLKAHPDEPRLLNNLGLVEANLGHTADAERLLNRYLALQPNAGDRDFIQQELAKLGGISSQKAI